MDAVFDASSHFGCTRAMSQVPSTCEPWMEVPIASAFRGENTARAMLGMNQVVAVPRPGPVMTELAAIRAILS